MSWSALTTRFAALAKVLHDRYLTLWGNTVSEEIFEIAQTYLSLAQHHTNRFAQVTCRFSRQIPPPPVYDIQLPSLNGHLDRPKVFELADIGSFLVHHRQL